MNKKTKTPPKAVATPPKAVATPPKAVLGPVSLAGVLRDKELRDELMGMAAEGRLGADWRLDADVLRTLLSQPEPAAEFRTRPLSEAIVRIHGRPSLLVQNDAVTMPPSEVLTRRLKPHVAKFTPPLKSVGRIELVGHPDFEWVGTGWMIDENTIVTNRHVAAVFARRSSTSRGYVLVRDPAGQEVLSKIDFREEFRVVGAAEFQIDKILFVAPHADNAPDVAFLRIVGTAGLQMPPPISAHAKLEPVLKEDRWVAVVGYPARDSRSDPSAMSQVFGNIYDVKRFAPGVVMGAEQGAWWFTHDCSTLGGNSGSVVLDVETGKAIGLHFAGTHGQANYAVRIDTVLDLLAGARARSTVPVERLTAGLDEKVRSKSQYTATGYDQNFLGLRIAMPTLSNGSDLVRVQRTGDDPYRLDYMHFSVRMSQSRRLPAVTAVNIDGRSRKKLARKGQTWFFDARIGKELQVGKAFYGPTDFDRGHMVRREDPVWGPDADAKLANEDTFHYTNAAPQHPDLNQREWLELEDYILDNADARDLKVSVFTGPVFDDQDPEAEGVQIPLRFWKVAAVIDSATGRLATAGYLLSQQDMVAVEFRYGRFKTYQVAIREIERLSGVKFVKAIRDADGYTARSHELEVPSWAPGIEIRRAEDVKFGVGR